MDLIESRSILSLATGFIRRGGFDWTCNPYVGCSFGCTYCYAAYLPQNRRPVEDWGRWFTAKRNAVELARKQGHKAAGQAVYMSSATDPYQPAERSLMLTRGVLEELLPHQPRLVVQTRGPLVVRDIDILSQYRAVRVNVSVPTDSERVRRLFEPKAPPLDRRWAALHELMAAGVPVGVCVTPTLPIEDDDGFARRIADLSPDVLVCQDFHDAGGRFGADTGDAARQLLAETGWSPADYRRLVNRLREAMTVYEGEAGFFPPPAAATVPG
ncbi:MAG: radical SAM protein [Gemmataceae bacterium]|nr:radical SAM protein [Gemmataceae bacterium]